MSAIYALEIPGGAHQPPHTYRSRRQAQAALRRWLRLDRAYWLGPIDSEEEVRDRETGEYRVAPTTAWLAYPSRAERDADQDGAYAPRVVARRTAR